MQSALWFSGGKDSLACLYLLESQWDDLIVVWANTGKNFPEVLDTVNRVRQMVPHFVEVAVDRDAQNAQFGLPSQIVPINWTRYAMQAAGKRPDYLIQPYLNCCAENIAVPLFNWCKANGITMIYKGQRNDEAYTSPSRHGTVVDGVEFRQPIENWSKDEVMAYLADKMPELPEHLRFDHSSMDCYDCTAFLEHSADRVAYMRDKYPEKYKEFKRRLGYLQAAIQHDMTFFEGL